MLCPWALFCETTVYIEIVLKTLLVPDFRSWTTYHGVGSRSYIIGAACTQAVKKPRQVISNCQKLYGNGNAELRSMLL